MLVIGQNPPFGNGLNRTAGLPLPSTIDFRTDWFYICPMNVGRPMEFDPDAALTKAMEVFWSQGYEGTSTANLMSAMGLSKSSLYQTFGSKRQLFIQCLEHYCQQSAERKRAKLAGAMPSKPFLIDLFRSLATTNKKGRTPKGCLLVNTACEFGDTDKELGSFVKSRLEKSRKMFQETIERAQRAGEIPCTKNAQHLSGLLMMSASGLQVMRKLNIDQSILESVVDQVLAQLD